MSTLCDSVRSQITPFEQLPPIIGTIYFPCKIFQTKQFYPQEQHFTRENSPELKQFCVFLFFRILVLCVCIFIKDYEMLIVPRIGIGPMKLAS